MTLPETTLRLLQERYSEAAMREWRRGPAPDPMAWILAFQSATGEVVAAIDGFGRCLFNLTQPRPTYAPLSPLTIRLLAELYGGTE